MSEAARLHKLDFAVEGVTCPACMLEIESGLAKLDGIAKSSFNLTTHRLTVEGTADNPELQASILNRLDGMGYKGRPFELGATEREDERQEKSLLRSMAVAGFAAGNIMLLSVSIWAGNYSGIAPETRDLFHWISALIAIPAVAYSGQPFFQSAMASLAVRRLNMDVPISLAVILAVGMSIVQTFTGARDAYFDSAVMLLFFLLIGRYLDFRSRLKTRNLGQNMLTLQKPTLTRLKEDGTTSEIASAAIVPGDRIIAQAGDRIGIDGKVISGKSRVDVGLISGESKPVDVAEGSQVYAGTINLSGPLVIEAGKKAEDTLLSEISNLMDKASAKRGRYMRLADRAATLYAPVVHSLALLAFLGWMFAGYGWQTSLLTSIAVLIITCPCALGLAVPVVQVVATGSLFRAGILVNSGDALERLAKVDYVVFDKTGTLTEPEPAIFNIEEITPNDLAMAARLAKSSHHVLARAFGDVVENSTPIAGAQETAGEGVSVELDGILHRLGSRRFCAVADGTLTPDGVTELWYRSGNADPVAILFAQRLKKDAAKTVKELHKLGLSLAIVSGDRLETVAETAGDLAIDEYKGGVMPQEKIAYIEELQSAGHNVLMVGDGLNDAAALQAANVSAAPASALDITQAAADIVILGNRLERLTVAIKTSRLARRLMLQNFGFAGVYNSIAIPLAVLGIVTPLLAALFMSGSSVVVTLNALRAQVKVQAHSNAKITQS
jgi:Cu2+-exporting ATPase